MQYTSNYNFDLPEANDDLETASRTAFEDNFTDLDTLLKDIEDDIDDVQDDISGLDAKTGDDIPFESGSADSISDKINILYNLIVPVGSVLCFTNDTNPNDIYSGTTWEKIEGRFLLGSSNDYALGSTGGEATHTLTVNEMPSHKHQLNCRTGATSDFLGGSTADYGINDTQGITYTTSGSPITNTGGGQAHNNMPPYEVVNYWKRVA